MSDSSPTPEQSPDTQRVVRRPRPLVNVDLGTDIAEPRIKFATNTLHVSDKTVARMNLPTVYIGNVAHVLRNESLKIIAARAQRRNQPTTKRRRRT